MGCVTMPTAPVTGWRRASCGRRTVFWKMVFCAMKAKHSKRQTVFGPRRDGEQDAPRTRKLGSLRYAAEDMLRLGARVSRNDRSGGYTTGAADNPRPIRGRMASDG